MPSTGHSILSYYRQWVKDSLWESHCPQLTLLTFHRLPVHWRLVFRIPTCNEHTSRPPRPPHITPSLCGGASLSLLPCTRCNNLLFGTTIWTFRTFRHRAWSVSTWSDRVCRTPVSTRSLQARSRFLRIQWNWSRQLCREVFCHAHRARWCGCWVFGSIFEAFECIPMMRHNVKRSWNWFKRNFIS